VKRLTLLAATLFALLSAACGGSGTGVQPPPPTGKFTLASLKGNYAFSMTGEDLTFGFLARVGSFVADGNGNITGGIEDLDDNGLINNGAGVPVDLGTGTYTMPANGKGTITFQSGLALSFCLSSAAPNNSGLIIQTDLNASSSGTFTQQDTSFFTTPFAAANYVFDFSGSDNVGASLSFVGVVAANAGGTLGAGTLDRNDANIQTDPSGPLAITTGGSYVPDNNLGNNANFGRTVFSFGPNQSFGSNLQFAMYPVNQTHIKFLEIDGTDFTSGDAFEQMGTIPTQASGFTNSFVYLVGGSAIAQGTPITRAARFTPDGNGTLGMIREDHNLNGAVACLDPNDNVCSNQTAAGSYTITPGNGDSLGRGTLSIPLGANTSKSVFYLASPNTAVIQDTNSNEVADGTMLAQAGSLSTSGNFIFNLTGQVLQSGANVGFEEDFVGQFALSSSTTNNITGTSDFTELGSTSKHSEPFPDIATSGTFTVNGDGTQRNVYDITLSPSDAPATTIHFTAYIGGSPPQLLLIGTDKQSRVTVGTVLTQTSPQ